MQNQSIIELKYFQAYKTRDITVMQKFYEQYYPIQDQNIINGILDEIRKEWRELYEEEIDKINKTIKQNNLNE